MRSLLNYICSFAKKRHESKICFVIAAQNKGYILDRIAKEIGRVFENPAFYYTNEKSLPKAEKYFVTHYSLLDSIFKNTKKSAEIFCFFTHEKGHLKNYLKYLKLCRAVIAENQEGVDILLSHGLDKDKLYFVPECADPSQFKPHERTSKGSILVCGTNYEDGRKNPELVEGVIKSLPNRNFILLGKNWDKFSKYPNVEISKVDYDKYSSIYERCSIYLSCSKLEGGGPNSLIEAMHTNLMPVVSDTGNAQDYIINGDNGFIFSHNASHSQVAEIIEKAYNITSDISRTVEKFTWQYYSAEMSDIILDMRK